MPNKQFELCKVCRLNHNQGRGHRYSARHKQRLAPLLSKALHKIKDVSFFLNNPARLRESDRPLNAFWCTFCEEKISEDSSVFVCSNTIRHLASSTHVETLKKYWYENGADVGKRHLYAFQTEELAKWEDACKALSAASTSRELSPGSVNRMGAIITIQFKTLTGGVWVIIIPRPAG